MVSIESFNLKLGSKIKTLLSHLESMADDIVVLANFVAEGGKDLFAKSGDNQVDRKEDGRHQFDYPVTNFHGFAFVLVIEQI